MYLLNGQLCDRRAALALVRKICGELRTHIVAKRGRRGVGPNDDPITDGNRTKYEQTMLRVVDP